MLEPYRRYMEPVKNLPPAKRWMLGGVTAVTLVAFVILIVVANRTDYRPLFANVSNEDAGEIVKKLKEQKVPYHISADGRAILVPSDKVHELRLSLASEGLPQGGGVGFEIFDRKNFGMTEFVQKLNYQRALQGELSRTISQLGGVEQARVHLVIPEKSLFKDAEKPATASVVLKMKGGGSLRENEVQGIVHLVASSIEGMDPDNVSVIDQRGKVLSRGVSQDQNGKMTSAMMETQRTFERGTEDRLQSLLDRVVGPGKSVARVSATFDFKQVEKFEERYDPESAAVRSEQRSEEKNGGGSAVSGVPGVQTNLGRTTPGANAAGGSGGSRSDETFNYEVSRSTARIIEPVGALAKISVAILVDGKYEGAGKEGAAKAKYAARTPEELQKIESLVKSAVGFNGDRGDQVTVANIPFQDTSEEAQPMYKEMLASPAVGSMLKNVLIGIAFLGVLFLVIRPMMKSIRATLPQSFEPEVSPEEEAQKLIAQERAQKTRASMSQLDLIEKVKGDPYQAAQIIQNWIEQK